MNSQDGSSTSSSQGRHTIYTHLVPSLRDPQSPRPYLHPRRLTRVSTSGAQRSACRARLKVRCRAVVGEVARVSKAPRVDPGRVGVRVVTYFVPTAGRRAFFFGTTLRREDDSFWGCAELISVERRLLYFFESGFYSTAESNVFLTSFVGDANRRLQEGSCTFEIGLDLRLLEEVCSVSWNVLD